VSFDANGSGGSDLGISFGRDGYGMVTAAAEPAPVAVNASFSGDGGDGSWAGVLKQFGGGDEVRQSADTSILQPLAPNGSISLNSSMAPQEGYAESISEQRRRQRKPSDVDTTSAGNDVPLGSRVAKYLSADEPLGDSFVMPQTPEPRVGPARSLDVTDSLDILRGLHSGRTSVESGLYGIEPITSRSDFTWLFLSLLS